MARADGYLSLIAACTFFATSGGICDIPCAFLACSAPFAITSATSLPSITKLQPGTTSPHRSTLAITGLLRLGVPPEKRLRPRQLGSLRSEEHTSELQSLTNLVCRLLLE